MASKNFFFLIGILFLFSTAGFAQTGYDVKDSSVISTKNMPQHTEFLNGAYNFPARPRDQWELGLHGGLSFFRGDISPLPGFGGGFSLRKSLGHTFSVRADYTGSVNYGLDYRPRSATALPANDPWRRYGTRLFVPNYKNAVHQVNLDFIATLNNKSYYRSNPKNNIYVLGGYSFLAADVDVNALRPDNTTLYNFSGINFSTRKNIRKELKALIEDDSRETKYEQNAFARNGNRDNIGRYKNNQLLRHAISGGAGFAYKLSNKVNLAIEQRVTLPFDQDNMDGVNAGRANDILSYTSARLNLNLSNKNNRIQPLWWVNPLDYVYSEIRNPRLMRIPKPLLPDSDGDGVTDQFDLEQTPKGSPVDSHGVTLDTDGDGVPDDKDKELITPTHWQPVNADGVGKSPCPDKSCFPAAVVVASSCDMKLGALPSCSFAAKTVKISADAGSLLASIASRMRNNPECKVVVVGYCSSNKQEQQLSWDRVNAVINYMVEKEGVSADRFIFQYAQEGGDCNTVDLRSASEGEAGPNVVPAPHPNLRKK